MTTWTKDGVEYILVPGEMPNGCKGCVFERKTNIDRCPRDDDEHHGCVTAPTQHSVWVEATPENIAIAVAHRMTR